MYLRYGKGFGVIFLYWKRWLMIFENWNKIIDKVKRNNVNNESVIDVGFFLDKESIFCEK